MMWVPLCDPLMAIHYKLFKYGTWYGHRVSDRVSVFDFCSDASSNPVVEALDCLARTLFEPEQQASLTGIFELLGRDMGNWPAAAKQALHVSVLLAFPGCGESCIISSNATRGNWHQVLMYAEPMRSGERLCSSFWVRLHAAWTKGFRRCCENMRSMTDV